VKILGIAARICLERDVTVWFSESFHNAFGRRSTAGTSSRDFEGGRAWNRALNWQAVPLVLACKIALWTGRWPGRFWI